ncbi:MAG: hypothetical protein RJA61_504 [Candidatus Parcubacteria bacterium]
MPELPEVHTTATKLNQLITGLVITDVWSDYFSPLFEGKQQIKNKKYFEQFKKDVIGAHIISVGRRAKNVLIHLSNSKTILVHMKMTGHLLYGTYKKNSKEVRHKSWTQETWIPDEKENSPLWDSYNRFIHLVLSLSNKKNLILSDVRKFAKVAVENTRSLFEGEHLGSLGPEPLENNFTFEIFKERIGQKPNWPIKTTLMNQELIAGIGNIYSDEMLWRAGIHPLECVENISKPKIKLLFKELKETLSKGIDFGGDSTSDYRQPDGSHGEFQGHHMAYKRKNILCLKKGCGGMMKRIVVAGRSAHFCEKHQTI